MLCAIIDNSNFNAGILDKLVEAIGDNRAIYWINAVKADDSKFNEKFANEKLTDMIYNVCNTKL